jgi:hypothetical protein
MTNQIALEDKDNPDYGLPTKHKSDDEFLAEMRQRAQWCFDAHNQLYEFARRDVEFCDVPGHQWDEWSQNQRKGRPCYEFNKVRKNVQQITNEQRQNRIGIKIRALRDATEQDAEIRMGMIRNIEAVSFAEHAYDTAFDFAVKGGLGFWRIKTQYCDDDAFDQEIRIEAIEDPYSVMYDPSAKRFDRKDARYAFVWTKIPRSEFKQRWPDATVTSFSAGQRSTDWDMNDWWGEQEVRIAEYFFKVPVTITIHLMSDGSTISDEDYKDFGGDLAKKGITHERARKVETFDCYSCIASGTEILDRPQELMTRNIPLVPLWGNLTRTDGKDYWSGEVRFQRDAQKLYNYDISTLVEVIGKQPKQPLFASIQAIKGYEKDYESMGHSDKPVLLFNADPSLPGGGMPQRAVPPQFPQGLAQAAGMAADDLKSTSGVYDATAGRQGNEISGVAINARVKQGSVSNFQYQDNMAKAKVYTGEILLEMIPKVYDTDRQIRILGVDGQDKIVEVNHAIENPDIDEKDPEHWITINDLSLGKFDIVSDVGPSYITERMEAAEAMSNLAQVPGPAQALLQYGYIKTIDVPDMDEIKEAFRMMLVKSGQLPPEPGDAPPQPAQAPPPNPLALSKAQLQAAQAAKAYAEASKTHVETAITAQAAPLEMQHTAAVTAKEQAHAISKIPPLPADPTQVQPLANSVQPLAGPTQF